MTDKSTPLPFFLVDIPLIDVGDVDVEKWLRDEMLKMGIIERELRIVDAHDAVIKARAEKAEPAKRTPTEVERKFVFHSEELIKILGLTGKRVSKVGYSAAGDWWEIMTTDDA